MRGRRAGFTLIEMIVSLAITVVIAAFLFSFSSSLSSVWRTSEKDVDTELDVNIALDQIQKDLESAILEERGETMFAVSAVASAGATLVGGEIDVEHSGRWEPVTNTEMGRPVSSHFDPMSHRYGWAGVWLRFFSAQPSVNAIAYQLIRRPAYTDSEIPRYLLHRSVVRQDYTLKAGFDITTGDYEANANSSYLNAPQVRHPQVRHAILANVVDFGVRLYVFDEGADGTDFTPDGLTLIFPEVSGSDLDLQTRIHYGKTHEGTELSERYPDVVEVYLRVLSQRGADLLYRSEELEAGDDFETIVERHSRVYRRMIRIQK